MSAAKTALLSEEEIVYLRSALNWQAKTLKREAMETKEPQLKKRALWLEAEYCESLSGYLANL